MLYADLKQHINDNNFNSVRWIFCPGHAGARGNERADELAGPAQIGGTLTLDPPTVLASAHEKIFREENEESHSLGTKRKGDQTRYRPLKSHERTGPQNLQPTDNGNYKPPHVEMAATEKERPAMDLYRLR